MHPKEIENILKLNPFDRYQYFIRKIADWETAYTLIFPDGNYAISTIDDKNLLVSTMDGKVTLLKAN